MNPGDPLKDVLHKIMNGEVDREKAQRDGARFHQALQDVSFDLGEYDMSDVETYEAERIPAFQSTLEASLQG